MLYFIAEGGGHDRLYGVHTVFGLGENHRLLAFENFVGDLHVLAAEFFAHFLSDRRFLIVIGGQAMHENGVLAGCAHKL